MKRDQIGLMTTTEVLEYMKRVRDLPEVGSLIHGRLATINLLAKKEAELLEQAREMRLELRQKASTVMARLREDWSAEELRLAGLDHIE